jgi:hypothetical protein
VDLALAGGGLGGYYRSEKIRLAGVFVQEFSGMSGLGGADFVLYG